MELIGTNHMTVSQHKQGHCGNSRHAWARGLEKKKVEWRWHRLKCKPRKGLQIMYAFFWVITWRLEFKCRRFGTLCSIFIGR